MSRPTLLCLKDRRAALDTISRTRALTVEESRELDNLDYRISLRTRRLWDQIDAARAKLEHLERMAAA